jgi:hypothetical protein
MSSLTLKKNELISGLEKLDGGIDGITVICNKNIPPDQITIICGSDVFEGITGRGTTSYKSDRHETG